MKKSKKILSLLLLLGMLSSCGGNSSIAPETSGKASEATSEVVSGSEKIDESSDEIIKALIPTFTADEDITQTGLNLTDGYRFGDTLSFEVSLPSMYKDSTLEVTLNGTILAPAGGIYSYTVLESDTALEITASADLIDITPTITKDEEIDLVGLNEVVHPNTEISFSVEAPEKLTITTVTVNEAIVRKSSDGKYYYTLEKTDTECAIAVESEFTKVRARGSISYKEGKFTKNQSDFISVELLDDEGTVLESTTTFSEGKLNYQAVLPKFADYTVKVIYTDDDEVEHVVLNSTESFDQANIVKDFNVTDDVAERTKWVDNSTVQIVESKSNEVVKHFMPKGVINAEDDFLVTFDWSYTGKIRDDAGEFLDDPTNGATSNKNASWSVDTLDSSGESLTRYEHIAWGGTWYDKHYGRGTSNDFALGKNINIGNYLTLYRENMKEWNTAEGTTYAIARRTINGVAYHEVYLVEDGQYRLSTHIPLTSEWVKEVTGLALTDFNGGYASTNGTSSVTNIRWERNPFKGSRFEFKPGYDDRASGTAFYLTYFTGFSDNANKETNGTAFRLADQDFILKYHLSNPRILTDDLTSVRTSGAEIGNWAGMSIMGRCFPYGDGYEFTPNFFHNASNTGTNERWIFRPIFGKTKFSDCDLTSEEIFAVGKSKLNVIVQKKGWTFEVYTEVEGRTTPIRYISGGEMAEADRTHWMFPYYLDVSAPGAADSFKATLSGGIDSIIFSPNADEFLTH